MKAELIAPCGMNCQLCYAFIRDKKPCAGCRTYSPNKPTYCSNCKIVRCSKRLDNGWSDCSLCDKPCLRLKSLDKRYRDKYHMSMIENLRQISEHGMKVFLHNQEISFTCPNCGNMLSVHQALCPHCQVNPWIKE